MHNENQNPEEEMVEIPHEYLTDGMKHAAQKIQEKMTMARAKYGNQYNRKNDYEEFGRRFGYNDPEKILSEYVLVENKQSKEPAIIRNVVKLLGDMARYHAIGRMRDDLKRESEG